MNPIYVVKDLEAIELPREVDAVPKEHAIEVRSSDRAKLGVDTNAVAPFSVAYQCFEVVAGRDPQKIETDGCVQSIQFASGNGFDIGKALDAIARKQAFGVGAFERQNHRFRVYRLTI